VNGLPAPARACLAAGLLGLLLCLINQASAPELSPALQRSAVLASLMAVGLMLVALLWTRANPKAPERVYLEGHEGLELIHGLPEALAAELSWGSRLLLTATPAASVLIHWQGVAILRRGVLSAEPWRPGAISERSRQTGKAISLVNLALYPGRQEFTGLPAGTPAVLIQPIGGSGWVVLGGWSPRCFSRADETWLEGWAEKIRTSLEGWSGESGRRETPLPETLLPAEPEAGISPASPVS